MLLPQAAVPAVSPLTIQVTPILQQKKPKKQLVPKLDKKLLEQIKKNHPNLEESYVREVASVIQTVSKKHNIKPYKIAAIAMQESSYQLDATNCYKVKGKERCDYCMMQINDRTAKNFGFDKERLMTDLNYCVEAGAKVLKDFKRMYGKKELEWWTRYNSSDDEKRQIYKEKVERWL